MIYPNGSRSLVGLLALLILLCAAPSFGAVRFDVVGSPTEVINTGRSEVLGSVSFFVRGTGNITGTSTGGASQIGLIFTGPALQIDNTTASGILLFWSGGFAAAPPSIVSVENRDIQGQCSGFVTINLPPGATPADGDFIRIEGIRGRIDAGPALAPGTDLFVDIQSINDPAANSFSTDRVRVAKSLKGLRAEVLSDSLTYQIRITEGFARAFIDMDAGNDGVNANDRTDSVGNALGAPTNSTRIAIRLDGVPSGISDVVWPGASTDTATGASLRLLSSTFAGSTATAIYSYESANQSDVSDLFVESFSLHPGFVFSSGKCSTDGLSTSVTLAPAVAGASGCAAPSSALQRPRFLEVYELLLDSISPNSAVVDGDSFVLNVRGAGFVQGATVLWNGEARATTFLSATHLTASIPASDLGRVGTATVRVSNPLSVGGGLSGPRMFTIAPHALTLSFARVADSPGSSSAPDDSEFTGMAVANVSGAIADVKLTALDASGNTIEGAGFVNPARLTLAAGEQLPVLAGQVFGQGLSQQANPAWVKLEGNVAQVVGFFLSFNRSLSRLDGADVSIRTLTSMVFPEVENSGFTQLHVANPNDDPASLTFELIGPDGSLRGSPAARAVNANGAVNESVGDLFPGVSISSSDYVRVTSDRGVAPFEYFGRPGADVAGLNGQDSGGGAAKLYSPQYVVGGGQWSTILTVVNLSSSAGNATFRFIADDGTQIGSTRVMAMAPRGKIRITDQSFFVDAGSVLRQGYVEIIGSGIRLTGSVVFRNPVGSSFSAALPLVSELRGQMVFSHVASNLTFFTGLSILGPGDAPARVIIQVFDRTGRAIASRIETIPARGRKSMLLTEYFPELAGRNLDSGYFKVSSPVSGVVGFALFGTNDLSVLSAIPPQDVP